MTDSHRIERDEGESLLALGEAAHRLGVHPATLRRWAKRGDVVYMVTPGGHRRFPESEIRRLASRKAGGPDRNALQSALERRALTHTRSALDHHREAGWISRMDQEDRLKQRELGRRVMGLLMQFVAADDDGEDLLMEARNLGVTYAQMTEESGLTLSQTLQALMFFRDNIVESVVLMPESTRHRPATTQRVLRRANTFLNAILLGVTESRDK